MSYDNYFLGQKEINSEENLEREGFFTNPTLVFLYETMLSYLRELSFYLLELKKLGITNEVIKENVLEALSGLFAETEYSSEQFYAISSKIYSDLSQAKQIYHSISRKHNLEIKFLKHEIKNPQKLTFSEAIQQGQKLFNNKLNKFSKEQTDLFKLIFNLLKSICVHMVELKELDNDNSEAYEIVLQLLNAQNAQDINSETMEELISKLVKMDNQLLVDLYDIKSKRYGEIIPTEVSLSVRPNKAILVSGTNLIELEMLLKATKNTNIDIYTHGHMLTAHSYPKIKEYKNLVGHWGKGLESHLLDFAEFPGAVFLTKHSFYRTHNLYRSRVFTTDVIAPKSISVISNYDFQPLINAALDSKGFTKTVEKPPIKLGFDENKTIQKMKDVAERINKGEIKKVLFVGVSNKTKTQTDYFEKFLKILPDNCLALSFSYSNDKDNVLLLESDYGFPIVYKFFNIITSLSALSMVNIVALFTRCEVHTISNVIFLANFGIKKIYFTDCSPTLVEPTLIETLREKFNLKRYTTPENDLKDILAD